MACEQLGVLKGGPSKGGQFGVGEQRHCQDLPAVVDTEDSDYISEILYHSFTSL